MVEPLASDPSTPERPKMNDSSPATVAILQQAGAAVIADCFDAIHELPPVLANDLWPTKGYGFPFAGPAYTIDGVTRQGPRQGDTDKLRAIDDMPAGTVALFAGNGMRGVCCFGDLLASAMRCRGVAGVVVDGGVRDFAFLRELDLPMLVRYRTPAQAIGRWKVTACQQPVRVRGALVDWLTVAPGDIVVSDDDGAIAVPAGLAGEIAARAAAWEAKDQSARADIIGGMKLLDAVRKHGAL
jgi:4-hydroxy-4-methyl-2-oxoglutarate aldolase